jgi:membrane-bound serine protease (ClpP class)
MPTMNRIRTLALLVPLAASLITGLALSSAAAASSKPSVLELRLNGVVDPFMASYVKRGVAGANDGTHPAALILIDTPGGLGSSMREIIEAIAASRVPVLCYTAPTGARAASAGTFIMMGCPVAAMAPGTNIGAAHPVGVSGAVESAKVTNDAAALIRSLATRWGRNADWAEKAVRESTSLTAETAVRIHAVDLLAPSVSALLAQAGRCALPSGGSGDVPAAPPITTTGLLRTGGIPALCGASTETFGMSAAETLFHGLADPNLAFILLNIGFIALIVFVIHPGFHISLLVGVVATVLGLLILETLPVRLVGIVLLLVAAVLFVLDVKARAHGVLTTGGVAMLILGGLLLFNPAVPEAHVSLPLIILVAVAGGAFTFLTLRALVRAKEEPVRTGIEGLSSSFGTALTLLDPTGLVRVRAEQWTAESAGGSIPAGTEVRVVRVAGVKLIVEPVALVPSAGGAMAPGVVRESRPAAGEGGTQG